MAPTSVVPQTFWGRIPNASGKLALQSREPERGHSHDEPASPQRISKRKQLHPKRSPLATNAKRHADAAPCGLGLSTKARRLSLDHHLPAPHPLCADVPARAFRLSFSDEYLRNPHQYVQALITCDTLTAPIHRSHSTGSTGSRSRRSTPQSSARSKQNSSTSTRRSRAGRFHNLQLEQSIASAANSENEDANSVTTAASDLNDVADLDGQVPGTPSRARSRTAAAKLLKQESQSTPQHSASVSPGSPAADGLAETALAYEASQDTRNIGVESQKSTLESQDSADAELPVNPALEDAKPDHELTGTAEGDSSSSSSAPGSPEIPLANDLQLTPLTASDADNIPSFQRAGLVFSEDMDISLIAPIRPRSTVRWNKADPINISSAPMHDKLARAERHCCSILRLMPEQYLSIKLLLLKEGLGREPGTFKKRDAQRLCRIDVNKTSKIYEWFVTMGWLPGSNGIFANPPPPAQPSTSAKE